MTSSSDWDRRFFFFTPELASDVLLVLLDADWDDTPLLLLTVFPLLVTDTSPLVWATPVEDDSPFCAPFRQDSSEPRSCPAPLACMLPRFMQLTRCVYKRTTGAAARCGITKPPLQPPTGPLTQMQLRTALFPCSRASVFLMMTGFSTRTTKKRGPELFRQPHFLNVGGTGCCQVPFKPRLSCWSQLVIVASRQLQPCYGHTQWRQRKFLHVFLRGLRRR